VVLSLPLRHKDATQSRPYPLSSIPPSILPSILDSAIDSTPTSDREVEHHDAFEVRDHDELHALVFRVREVGVAALRGIKGHDKPVRKAVIQAFIALIDAMLHGEEPRDLTDHATHLGKALFNSRRRDALLEGKCAVVEDHVMRG